MILMFTLGGITGAALAIVACLLWQQLKWDKYYIMARPYVTQKEADAMNKRQQERHVMESGHAADGQQDLG